MPVCISPCAPGPPARSPRQGWGDSSFVRHTPPRYAARYAARRGYAVLWN